MQPLYLRHDYIETREGLLFAVVENGTECGRALCFLRYVRHGDRWRKLNTTQANALLEQQHPEYLFHSQQRDATLHGVPVDRVARTYSPRARAAEIAMQANDPLASLAQRILRFFVAPENSLSCLGVTGSLLVDAHTRQSDIDLVVFGREEFDSTRQALKRGIETGVFFPLSRQQWEDAWRRRGCPLTLDEYIWHERRKWNKAIVAGTKFDISQASEQVISAELAYRKLGAKSIVARVTHDEAAFAWPARWGIDHSEIEEVVSFTPTYCGQARAGEVIEASGQIEQSSAGKVRLVVGASREAPGEWIKVRK